MRQRKRTETKGLANLKMNDRVYALRRKVLAFVYEAKALFPGLPRIEIRVTENDPRILGMATVGECVIWITERMVANRETVYHEIIHAVFGVGHDPRCSIMKATYNVDGPEMPKAEADKIFLKYARKWAEGK
jgi:hypothetical protein